MANFDTMCFLEYYADRTSVVSEGLRTPTKRYQNFYQQAQLFGNIDNEVDGSFFYLAFNVDGFGSSEAASINNFSVTIAATAEIVDLSISASSADTLVVASFLIQDVGQDELDPSTAQVVSRYIGSIESVSMTDESVTWVVNPAIDKIRSQMPSKKISSNLLGRFVSV
jgi:hypothetical protein